MQNNDTFESWLKGEGGKEYLEIVQMFDPSRITFGDEKHLKGQELYNRNVRHDPITGFIPDTYTNGDFCNTYALTGFCGIDRASSPVWYSIHEDKNGADEFALQLEMALTSQRKCSWTTGVSSTVLS